MSENITATPNQQSLQQEHIRIADSVPDSELIAPSLSPNHLGSFLISAIEDGDHVPLSGKAAIEADFGNIEALGNHDLLDDFATYIQELEATPGRAELAEALQALEGNERDTFLAATFATSLATEFFSDKLVDPETRANFGWTAVDPKREDTYHIKKLSETSDDGLCAEYSLFVGEVMSQLGVEVSYTVGYRQIWSDEAGEYHAVLTTENGILIDPLLIAQTSSSKKPMGMLMAEPGASMSERPDNIAGYTDVFDRNGTYSASPIPASEQFESKQAA